MKTTLLQIDSNNIDIDGICLAGNLIKEGSLVAFPTETVYGLGANGLDETACLKIFQAKGRPSDNPLILHISNFKQLESLVAEISEDAKKIMDKFCPAPLTLVFKKSDIVPDVVSGGLDTVAVRFPKHTIARSIIENAGVPIAAPSANLSGKPSCTKASHVVEDLWGKIPMIVDGGECELGLESTIIDTTTVPFTLLRPGFVTVEQIEEVVGKIQIDKTLMEKIDDDVAPKAPGMKYIHYSPEAEVVLFEYQTKSGKEQIENIEKINELILNQQKDGKKVGVLTTNKNKEFYKCDVIMSLGDENHLDEIGANLFSMLREMDDFDVDIVYAETFMEKGEGLAIMNRLKKASGYNIVKL